jgi:hypothetical protein
MESSLLLGILGTGLILIAFVLEEMKKLTPKDRAYQAINAIGSAFLIYYAILLGSWPFIILNFVWCAFSVWRWVRG